MKTVEYVQVLEDNDSDTLTNMINDDVDRQKEEYGYTAVVAPVIWNKEKKVYYTSIQYFDMD